MNTSYLFKCLLFFSLVTIFINCGDKEEKKTSVITEIFEIKGADEDFAAGNLKFMESENLVGKLKKERVIYNPDQSIKGKEVYHYVENGKRPKGSSYYGPEGNILSTYQYYYQDSLLARKEAFEGESEELLRIEAYQYNPKGFMIRKVIYDGQNNRDRTYIFGHDEFGNEISMMVKDKDDNQLFTESYEITKKDDKNRWTEKYGYKNGEKKPMTYYKRSRND